MTPPNDTVGAGSTGNPYEPPKSEIGPPAREPMGTTDRPGRGGCRPTPAAQFPLECRCGLTTLVAASQAGSTVRCQCGAEVKVPSLGRLRELSGKDRYESGTIDTIRRMVKSGELPSPTLCPFSHKPTDDFLEFKIVVPKFFNNEAAVSERQTLLLVFGLWALLYEALLGKPKYQEESAEAVPAPIRVSSRYHAKVGRMSQRRLRRLLATVPVYAKLLGENPDSRIALEDLVS